MMMIMIMMIMITFQKLEGWWGTHIFQGMWKALSKMVLAFLKLSMACQNCQIWMKSIQYLKRIKRPFIGYPYWILQFPRYSTYMYRRFILVSVQSLKFTEVSQVVVWALAINEVPLQFSSIPAVVQVPFWHQFYKHVLHMFWIQRKDFESWYNQHVSKDIQSWILVVS